MHILMMPAYYPSPERPITGIFYHEQGLALKKAGYEIGVLVLPRIDVTRAYVKRVGLRSAKAVSREDYFTEFPVYRMHWGWFPRFAPMFVTRFLNQAGLAAFDHYCRLHGTPDIIHAHNIFYGGYLAAQIKRKYGIPVVLTEHSTSYMEGLIIFPGQPAIIRNTLRGIDVRIAVSQALADAINVYDATSKIIPIGNMVDTRFFTPDPTARAQTFTFCAIGRLAEQKRYSLVLEAFSQQFKGTEVTLRIGGDGPLRQRLESEAAALGVQNQVVFLGQLTREQVRDELRRGHVHVSCSVVESFGVTLVESMACGTPVIATRCGGPEGFVEPETGLLIPVNDVPALGVAMRHLFDHYADYNPQTIRDLAESRFSEGAIVQQLDSIYRAVRERK